MLDIPILSQPIPPTPSHPNEGQGDLVVERQKQRTTPPPMYQVIMLNDDFTPMEFVVDVLMNHFHKSLDEATHIMLTVHLEGSCVCGVFTRDVAQSKIQLVLNEARTAGHPLQCIMQPQS